MRAILIALLAAALLVAGCESTDKEREWGTYQEPVEPLDLPRAAGASEINILWRKNLRGGAEQGYAILKPAYGVDGMYAANRGGSVFKLDLADGDTIWRRKLGAEIFSGVGVGDSLVAVALDNGTVVALDAQSGETLWESPLNRQISAVPAIGQGRVIARTAGGSVIALNAETGEVVWFLERAMPDLTIHGDSPPVISGDAVFVGLANGKLLANNVVNGREYWETEISYARGRNELERLTDSDTAPLVAAATVYSATYQGNVAALRLQDASVMWKAAVSSRLPMSLGGGRLLVTTDFGEVVAIDAETGEILWTQENFRGHGMSRPLVVGERVVVGDARGNLYSLDLADGTLMDSRRVTKGAVVAIIPRQDQFTVFSSEGRLSVLSLDSPEN